MHASSSSRSVIKAAFYFRQDLLALAQRHNRAPLEFVLPRLIGVKLLGGRHLGQCSGPSGTTTLGVAILLPSDIVGVGPPSPAANGRVQAGVPFSFNNGWP